MLKLFRRKKRKEEVDLSSLITNEVKVNEGESLVEFYPVNPPFGYVAIIRSRITRRYEYRVLEPPLTRLDQENIRRIRELVLESARIRLEDLRKSPEEVLRREVERVIKKYKVPVPKESLDKIMYYIVRDTLGYGPIDVPMRDPNVEDISCDGLGLPVYVWHRRYESVPTNIVFTRPEELESLLIKMAYRAGKHLSIAQPIVEGSLPGNYRIHLTLAEVSRRGGTFTVRKFREVPFSIIDLVKLGTVSPLMAAYFWLLIEAGKSVMVVGATASGKTTTLNALATFIRPEAKIVTIEDTPELNLPHENWVPLVTRPSYEEWIRNVDLYELLKSALRMRPDYIIIGEVRGAEAFTLFQAIATGHAGMCTMHAENVEYAVKRLMTKPMEIPLFLLPVMNVYATIRRIKVKDRIVRRIIDVREAVTVDPARKELVLKQVFKYNPVTDEIEFMGDSYIIERIAEEKFKTKEELMEELERRVEVIRYLVTRNITRFADVSRVVRDYYYNPRRVYEGVVARTYRV